MRYQTWHEAYNAACQAANQTGCDVAIRCTREYGQVGFNVSFAARNDSDYALAEIVRASRKG